MWNEKISTSQVRDPFASATSSKMYGAKSMGRKRCTDWKCFEM